MGRGPMTDIPLCILGLAVVALWLRSRPRVTVQRLFVLWWIGILLMRVLPVVVGFIFTKGPLHNLLHVSGWIGSLVFLRVVMALTLRGRNMKSIRTRICFGFLVLGLIVLLAVSRNATATSAIILMLPWLLSVKWRHELESGWLGLASVTGLVTLVLCAVSFSPDIAFRKEAVLPGFGRIWGAAIGFGIIYGAITTFGAAMRVHLSIRRIGRRLFVSHLMAGVVPFALASIFLLLASALFLSTYRGLVAERVLNATSANAARQLALEIGSPLESIAMPFGPRSRGQIIAGRKGDGPSRLIGTALPFAIDSLLALDESSHDCPLLWDGKTLYIRARVDTVLSGQSIRREALAPLDSLRMVDVSGILGIPVRVNPAMRVMRDKSGVTLGPDADSSSVDSSGTVRAVRDEEGGATSRKAIGPRAPRGMQLPGGAIVSCLRWSPVRGFRREAVPISSTAGLGEPILALFSIARENPLALVVIIVLATIALLLIMAAIITISMVVTMARSIMRSVGVLTGATAALREGKLDHRIEIQGEDELWRVAASFNEMAEGLERMREMELTNERLEEELRLARRIQERLLPESPPHVERLELAGLSLPARHVGGDYFDYIPLDGGRVAIAVADVSGKGVGAALLMSSFRASLRSQDLERQGPGHASVILNRFVCASVDPGKFITAFLAVLDPMSGGVRYVNAGHEPPLLLGPDGTFVELDRGGLIMGAFAQAEYEEGTAQMPPGSLLAIFTDGVTEARNSEGAFLGDEPLREILRRSNGASCAQLLQSVVARIHTFAGDEPQSDDITLLLAKRR